MSKVIRLAGVLSVISLITVFAVAPQAAASTVELVADSDSTLRRGYNNLNEGANKELFVMRDGPKRAIVSFDIGVLDPASQVVDAQMFLTVADDAVKWEDGRPVDLHRLLVSLPAPTVCWTGRAAGSTPLPLPRPPSFTPTIWRPATCSNGMSPWTSRRP